MTGGIDALAQVSGNEFPAAYLACSSGPYGGFVEDVIVLLIAHLRLCPLLCSYS